MPKHNRDVPIFFRVFEQEPRLLEEKMKLAGIQNMRAYLLKMAIDGYVIRVDLSNAKDIGCFTTKRYKQPQSDC